MSDDVRDRAREVLRMLFYWDESTEYWHCEVPAIEMSNTVIDALEAAGIALVDAAELDALLTFSAASRKEYVWRRCGEEARRRQCSYRPEQMEQWDKQYAEWWDDEHADVAAILQRRKVVTDD